MTLVLFPIAALSAIVGLIGFLLKRSLDSGSKPQQQNLPLEQTSLRSRRAG